MSDDPNATHGEGVTLDPDAGDQLGRNPMRRPVRVIDTGVRGARANIAFDQALIDAHEAKRIPETIRFLRFRPSALVGLHQILSHEIRVDYCRSTGIEIARRITGGGGLYLDEGQLGWELVLERRTLGTADLAEIAARICNAAAQGLRALGIPAAFRPRNDIEVDGRKISGTGGFIDGATLFYQGTLLIDFDPLRMIDALKIPAHKLAKHDLDDARRRVVTVREILGTIPPLETVRNALLGAFAEHLDIEPLPGPITEYEEQLAAALCANELGTDEFVRSLDAPDAGQTLVSATLHRRGGAMRADIRTEGANRDRVREALITGDFFVTPPRTILDLEAHLRGLAVADAPRAAAAFLERSGCDLVALEPQDFAELIAAALGQRTFRVDGHALRSHWRGPGPERAPTLVFLHDALGCARTWRDFPERLAGATGCGALIFDRWGSGDSEPLVPPHRPDYLLHEALTTLPQVLDMHGVVDAILIGQSDGAAIALAHAGARPARVRGVIALAPHLFRESRTLTAIDEQIEDFRRGDLRSRLRRHHGANADALFERLVEVWTGAPAGTGWGLESHVAQVGCPVFALQGNDDEYFSDAQLRRLGSLLGPRLSTLRLERCGHFPAQQSGRAVLKACTGFILGLLQPAGPASAAAPQLGTQREVI